MGVGLGENDQKFVRMPHTRIEQQTFSTKPSGIPGNGDFGTTSGVSPECSRVRSVVYS